MSRSYQIVSLLDIITKIESDLALQTEYQSLNIIPALQHIFDRHCFYHNDPELSNDAMHNAKDMLLEFDIEETAVINAIYELDREIGSIISDVLPLDYLYNITHRYLNHYSFLLEIYIYDSVRETVSRKQIFHNEAGGQCVKVIPAISAYGSRKHNYRDQPIG